MSVLCRLVGGGDDDCSSGVTPVLGWCGCGCGWSDVSILPEGSTNIK